MSTVTLGKSGDIITLKAFNRWVQKAYDEAMYKGASLETTVSDNADGTPGRSVGKSSMPMLNTQKAQEALVIMLTGKTVEQLDTMDIEDYAQLVKACEELRDGKKKDSTDVTGG